MIACSPGSRSVSTARWTTLLMNYAVAAYFDAEDGLSTGAGIGPGGPGGLAVHLGMALGFPFEIAPDCPSPHACCSS